MGVVFELREVMGRLKDGVTRALNIRGEVEVTNQKLPVEIVGNKMEYFGKSTDTKPTSDVPVGATFFEIDTTKPFMYDGSTWREI